MTRHLPAIIASIVASSLMFLAGYMYEGFRVRVVVLTRLELLADEVKALTVRVRELEQSKK